ncbi:hypothetical protein [Dyadobacter sp. CY323]|uniref:hypothetical protein n=1 Tax=Dyadobacter sp. CY323 TaxID=2907302 RepID=UPI001F2576B3|nr:hypothetical protein [Dyadobacter sp. CY323]MCE6992087.1 hypothetical protein [Dyadobacter sp. CY323]
MSKSEVITQLAAALVTVIALRKVLKERRFEPGIENNISLGEVDQILHTAEKSLREKLKVEAEYRTQPPRSFARGGIVNSFENAVLGNYKPGALFDPEIIIDESKASRLFDQIKSGRRS